jgi:hypothetical protein
MGEAMQKIKYILALLAVVFFISSCSSTQKTAGEGMVSVVAQNVVRIAGTHAIKNLDIGEVDGQPVFVEVTGFADSFSSGYVLNLLRGEVENQGGRLVAERYAELIVEVAVNAAGNDLGASGYIIGGSTRSEGTVDLTVSVRNGESGERLSRQQIVGYAKYQQGSFLGITGSGAYFVMDNGNWEIVRDPTYY